MIKSGDRPAYQYPCSISSVAGPIYKTIWFSSMTDDELKSLIDPPWPTATRKQLLAYFHNRYPCGYMFEDTPSFEINYIINK